MYFKFDELGRILGLVMMVETDSDMSNLIPAPMDTYYGWTSNPDGFVVDTVNRVVVETQPQ